MLLNVACVGLPVPVVMLHSNRGSQLIGIIIQSFFKGGFRKKCSTLIVFVYLLSIQIVKKKLGSVSIPLPLTNLFFQKEDRDLLPIQVEEETKLI